MKKLFVLLLSVFTFYLFTYSQGCLPEGIGFTTQQQIDEFPLIYPNCSDIEGSVLILGNDITNLDGLINIQTIGGELIISSNSLANLFGLGNLSLVDSTLSITNCTNLYNLEGLNNLNSIGGELHIWNSQLTDLTGLEGLTKIFGNWI
ncbi:MAG: hypothetical protein R2750_07825 [Bacteroidales bacterium]